MKPKITLGRAVFFTNVAVGIACAPVVAADPFSVIDIELVPYTATGSTTAELPGLMETDANQPVQVRLQPGKTWRIVEIKD